MEDSFPNTRSHENFSVVNVRVFLFKLSVGNKFTFPIDQGILLCKLLTLSLQSQSLFEQICSKQTHQVLQYQHDLCTTVSISISLVQKCLYYSNVLCLSFYMPIFSSSIIMFQCLPILIFSINVNIIEQLVNGYLHEN